MAPSLIRHRALVVTTAAAAGPTTNGAELRVRDVIAVLHRVGYDVERISSTDLDTTSGHWCLGVAVSYANAGAVRRLRRRCDAVWLDAVDSWLLVDLSGLRARRVSYLARLVRDAARLAGMPRTDLVTYISAADRRQDRATVRGRRCFVLPGVAPAPRLSPRTGPRRFVLAGDWGYAPNRDGLKWFTERCLPLLEHELAAHAWSADVYGADAPALPTGLVKRGYVQREEDLYQEGDVHLAPVGHGGGVKRKVLQPLLAGLPVVTTRSGSHGLRPHPLLDVSESPRAFVRYAADRFLESSRTGSVHPPALRDLVDADETQELLTFLARDRLSTCGCRGGSR